MADKLDESMPIYVQIMNHIRRQVVSGKLKPGERMPSVRELAAEFGVNPNTMQRALAELERERLLCSERTSGRFVTKDVDLIQKLRIQEADKATAAFKQQMEALGFSMKDAADFFLKRTEKEVKVG
ncbi:MAG: GntR family transcriptional regulator [Eubacteriales bacterium]|nr:GntR family transcriptional regulator [Eubacteriales bacterium]